MLKSEVEESNYKFLAYSYYGILHFLMYVQNWSNQYLALWVMVII